MKLNSNLFTDYIEENYESDMVDMLDNIDSYISKRCDLSSDTLEALHVVAKESYLAALKTIEDAFTSSCESSDTCSPES